jgi:tRNA dimethylallyltransferase
MELARRLDGEIVGCDSLQVYRELELGTAKPSPAERAEVPHHLVDCVDPHQDFSMADYAELAERALTDIASRGRVPIVVGGTGLYLRGLLRGVLDLDDRDVELQARLNRLVDRHGVERLHRLLSRLDPESAGRLDPRDRQRIVRAVEMALSGKSTWSEKLRSEGTWNEAEERFSTVKIGLDLEREALAARLDERVDRFFEAGLIAEVRGLLDRGVPRQANAFKAIGYREILQALDRDLDPELARAEVKRNTRRYSKRQRTWFRKEPGVLWLDAAEDVDELASRVVPLWKKRA